MPVFTHDEKDIASFRMITSQFYVNGIISQIDIINTFGVSKNSVKRAVKKYRLFGPASFYAKRVGRGAAILTPSVLKDIQGRLDEGSTVEEIAEALDLKKNTLEKTVRAGRLHVSKKKSSKY